MAILLNLVKSSLLVFRQVDNLQNGGVCLLMFSWTAFAVISVNSL